MCVVIVAITIWQTVVQKNSVTALYVPVLGISEIGNWFRGFIPKFQAIFDQVMKGAGEFKRFLVLPSSRRQWEQTYVIILTIQTPRISLLCGMQPVRLPPRLPRAAAEMYESANGQNDRRFYGRHAAGVRPVCQYQN